LELNRQAVLSLIGAKGKNSIYFTEEKHSKEAPHNMNKVHLTLSLSLFS
jgi:hypothetical protein